MSGIIATLLALAPKINNYLNEEPKVKRNLEQQMHYNDSIIENYPYSNLYLIEEPKGKNWEKFISCIKEKESIVIFYSAKKCIPCNYAEEYAINLAKNNKDKSIFIINHHSFEDLGEDLTDSLRNYNLNESTFPTFVTYKNGKQERFDFTRYDLSKLKIKSLFL